uniref:Putative secreted protein n=1 Tax=Ixodes ricinus TaxID=34613 RepID=V5HTA3_IXORI
MKYVLLIALATLGALGILVVSIYLLRRARIMNCEGAKSFRYIRLSQNSERVTESQCLVDVSTEEDDDEDDEESSSPATIDVESRTASVVKANGQSAYRRSSAVAENETDEELLQ